MIGYITAGFCVLVSTYLVLGVQGFSLLGQTRSLRLDSKAKALRLTTNQALNDDITTSRLHQDDTELTFAIRKADPNEMEELSIIVAQSFEEQPFQQWTSRWIIYLGMLERLLVTNFVKGLGETSATNSPEARKEYVLDTLQEIFVAEVEGHIAGVVELTAESCKLPLGTVDNTRQAPFVCNLGVLQDYRGLGLGRALVLRCEERTLECGLSELWLETNFDNTPALRLYSSQDFVAEGVDPEIRAQSIFGERRVFLRKRLSCDTVEAGNDILSFREITPGQWEAQYDLTDPNSMGKLTFVEKNFGALAPLVAALGVVVGGIVF